MRKSNENDCKHNWNFYSKKSHVFVGNINFGESPCLNLVVDAQFENNDEELDEDELDEDELGDFDEDELKNIEK